MKITNIGYGPNQNSRKSTHRVMAEEKYGDFKLVYSFVHDEKATNHFKSVFGEVVDKVFTLESVEPTGTVKFIDNELRWNNMQLVILFNNGKYVHMGNDVHANFELLL